MAKDFISRGSGLKHLPSLIDVKEAAYVCRAFGQQEASDGSGPSETGLLALLMSSRMTWLPGQETVWTHHEQQES